MNTTVEIVATWRARKDSGQPCWCGKPNDHVGWPVCADRATQAGASEVLGDAQAKHEGTS